MANITSTAIINVQKFRTKKQEKLLTLLNDKQVRKTVNVYIKDAINPYVPMKSGALRDSAYVTPYSIVWGRGLKYGGYQYRGVIYGPNLPIAINGSPAWRSRKGIKKHPTERMIGDFTGVLDLKPLWQIGEPKVDGSLSYKFGYTTPKTTHHWDTKFRYFVKLKTNLEITRYLKRECKRRGLK